MENTAVKKFWKLANICQSCERMYSGTFFDSLCTLWIKNVAPKTFCTKAKCISVTFRSFVASLYPRILTDFGRFILIFNIMVLIILEVLVVFIVSSFDFHEVKLPWLHSNNEWPQLTGPRYTGLSGFGQLLESYYKLQQKTKVVPEFKMYLSWFGLLYWIKPLTTPWKTTASDCRHVY